MTPPLTRSWDRMRGFVWLMTGASVGMIVLLQALDAAGFRGVTVERSGQTVSYRPSPVWLAILAVPPALMGACAAAGLTRREAGPRFAGAVFLCFAILFTVAAIPGVFVGGLTVRPDGFTHVAGGWWAPETKAVRFEELDSIAVRPETDSDVPRSFVLECRRRDGTVVSIPSSTVLRVGLRRVVVNATAAGVRVDLKAEKPG